MTSIRRTGPRRGRGTGLRRRLWLALSAGLVIATTSGCELSDKIADSEVLRFGFPEPVTDRGRHILELWQWSAIAALVVGALVWGLIFWSIIVYRKRGREELPPQVRYNIPIEVVYTVIPIVIVAVLFFFTVVVENRVNKVTSDAVAAEAGTDEVMTVGIVGFRWGWQFNYLGEDGKTTEVTVTGTGNEPPQLVLPTNRKIRFIETSPDVIHSFFVPQFLFKRDVIPGHPNTFELTIEKEGTFIGRCAEFCGVDHDRMNFQVRALPADEFDDFYAAARAGEGDTTTTAEGSNS